MAAARGAFGCGMGALAAETFEQDSSRFVAGLLRHGLAGEGLGEDGLAEIRCVVLAGN